MTITIEEVIQKINDWRDKQAEIQEMPGGLTNKNYRVEVDGQSYFVGFREPVPSFWQLTGIVNTIVPKRPPTPGWAPKCCTICRTIK